MSSSTSIEQQHQEFKRQMSAHDTYPCFLLDQTFQQRMPSPNATPMPSFLTAPTFSPFARSPMTSTLSANQSRLAAKQSTQYRLFPSSPSTNPSSNMNRTNPSSARSTAQIIDVPIEKTIVPLRTMTDLFPSFSYANMQISNKKIIDVSYNPQMSSSSLGVSVFGFREQDIELVVQQFQEIGPMESVERPMGCEHGNFLTIVYSSHVSCQNALNRDGNILNGYMIGVVPLIRK